MDGDSISMSARDRPPQDGAGASSDVEIDLDRVVYDAGYRAWARDRLNRVGKTRSSQAADPGTTPIKSR
jgi:hypothetical protein